MMDWLKVIGMWIGVIVMVAIIGAFMIFAFTYMLIMLGLMAIAGVLVVLFNIPLKIMENGEKIGTWKRSTGFTSNKEA